MIHYESGKWGVWSLTRYRGSVFPKAFAWALPNAVCIVLLHYFEIDIKENWNDYNVEGVKEVWASYTFILGFLLVFRSSQAYSRYWDGAKLIFQVRGAWFTAVSSLMAFCSSKAEMRSEVLKFQLLLSRLASMLYCTALQQVADLADDAFEILDTTGFDAESIGYLQHANNRCEIIMQWIQKLVIQGQETGVLSAPAPILSRAFQELGRGTLNLDNVRIISDIPFPFPYAQMTTLMAIAQWIMTVALAVHEVDSAALAAIGGFCVTFAIWCLVYIALELDQPFGDDHNDLPLVLLQQDFNRSLLDLLHPLAQSLPNYVPTMTETVVESSNQVLMHGKKHMLLEAPTRTMKFQGVPPLLPPAAVSGGSEAVPVPKGGLETYVSTRMDGGGTPFGSPYGKGGCSSASMQGFFSEKSSIRSAREAQVAAHLGYPVHTRCTLGDSLALHARSSASKSGEAAEKLETSVEGPPSRRSGSRPIADEATPSASALQQDHVPMSEASSECAFTKV